MGNELSDKKGMVTELRKAIERNEIHLQYQPQFDARTLTIRRFEALARWKSQALGPVPPNKFIPVAEESGVIRELGAYVLDRACRDAVAWNREFGTSIAVAVNVSAIQLRGDDFAKIVFQTLSDTGLAPELLELEVTESVMADDPARLSVTLEELRRAGVSLSLDDFGTGYSCLAYLRQLQFDSLKVDPSFLRQADLDSGTVALITAVVCIAHALDMRVVVEGIETDQEKQFVTALGADELQGYLLGRPTSHPFELLQALRHAQSA